MVVWPTAWVVIESLDPWMAEKVVVAENVVAVLVVAAAFVAVAAIFAIPLAEQSSSVAAALADVPASRRPRQRVSVATLRLRAPARVESARALLPLSSPPDGDAAPFRLVSSPQGACELPQTRIPACASPACASIAAVPADVASRCASSRRPRPVMEILNKSSLTLALYIEVKTTFISDPHSRIMIKHHHIPAFLEHESAPHSSYRRGVGTAR